MRRAHAHRQTRKLVLMPFSPDLSIIIVSWNVSEMLADCLRSVFDSAARSDLAVQVYVVDNASADGSADMVSQEFPQVHLTASQENLGFARGNNLGIQLAQQDSPRYLFLLNPDTIVRGQALHTLVQFMDATPRAALAGARLVYGDGSFQHSAFTFPRLAQLVIDLFPVPARLYETKLNGRYPREWYRPDHPPFSIDHPLGATMLVRPEVLETVGLLDESYFMYCEEIDWAMRIKAAGWQVFCVPAAEIVHLGGQSSSQIRAQSFVNLWKSRHTLYHKYYSPAVVTLAGCLVRRGMARMIRQAGDQAELKQACQQVAEIWQ